MNDFRHNRATEEAYVDRALTGGWRVGDIQLRVTHGKAILVASKIFELYDHVLETSTRVDSDINLVARVYYGNSQELHEFLEALKAIRYVKEVRFSEISAIIDRRAFIENNYLGKG
jgi:hypothetical protein